MERDTECMRCRLATVPDRRPSETCVPGEGRAWQPKLAMVSKLPLSGKRKAELEDYLREAGADPEEVFWTSVNRCKVWGLEPSKADIKACRRFLWPELAEVDPEVVVAVGNEALVSLTNHSGIMKYRGRELEGLDASRVLATISPAAVARNPGLRAGLIADLALARRLAEGSDAPTHAPRRVLSVTTPRGLRVLLRRLSRADGVYLDVETDGFNELAPGARLLTLSITLWGKDATEPLEVWAIPLAHPQSPWLKDGRWRSILFQINFAMGGIQRVVAHNGKFDLRWLRRFGLHTELTFDTLLAAHLLDENRPKRLEALCQVLLGVPNWKIDNRKLADVPLKRVLRYNALDTWYGAHLYFVLREQIKEQPRLAKLLIRMLIPASEIFVDIEQRGIWTDRRTLHLRAREAESNLAKIDGLLYRYCPMPSQAPARLREVNFNPSNYARWLLFEWMGFPILERGKEKEDGSPGDPSMGESIILRLLQQQPDNRFLQGLIKRAKWSKYVNAFFRPYEEQIDDQDRIHTNFKLTGTVTGRLSSGKADADKVSGRVQNRGVNLQQVPRDNFVRGIFGAPPGWVFVEADYSQIELRVAAFVAQERTMLRMYQMGEDIHMATAMRLTGRPASQVTKEERKKAKAVNFGFLYGMGWAKFIETAFTNYGLVVSPEEAQAARKAFFTQFPDLLKWHARQRALVARYKRVESPLGRVRHLPDIDSPNEGVRHEAERQAINSPVQAMASDMTLLALTLLQPGLKAMDLRARSVGAVHDALNFEVPIEEVPRVVPFIRKTMENLPLKMLFGVDLTVPVVSDVKIGTRWGSAEEVPARISSDERRLTAWLRDHSRKLRVA